MSTADLYRKFMRDKWVSHLGNRIGTNQMDEIIETDLSDYRFQFICQQIDELRGR